MTNENNVNKEVVTTQAVTNDSDNGAGKTFVTFSPEDSAYDDKQWSKLKREIIDGLSTSRDKIQIAAGQALIRAMSNDFNRANEVYELVRDNFNQRSASQLQIWFQTFGPFKMATDKEGQKRLRKSKSDNANPFDLQGASNNPWYKMEGFTSDELKEVFMTKESFLTRVNAVIRDAKYAIAHEKKTERTLLALKDESEKGDIENLIADLNNILTSYGYDMQKDSSPAKVAA